jgi:hypothetical protein
MADIDYNNMEVEALAKSDVLPIVVSDPPQQQESVWKSYFTSKDFFEVVGAVTFGVVAFLISKYAVSLRQRPIPAQQLNTGEYVVNLTYNDVVKHETISSESIYSRVV